MYMILFVLDNPDQLDELLEAWEAVGVGGATIIESTGIQRRKRKLIPMRYVYQTVGNIEENHYTLFAIVESLDVVQACLAATEQLVGDLDKPDTGVFTSWPLEVVKGLPRKKEMGE